MRTKRSSERRATSSVAPWIDEELSDAHFTDVRLGMRLRRLLAALSEGMGDSIPYACQDWANTKAAYRFFSNDRITDEEIMRGHLAATAGRAADCRGPILVLHDTTEFSFKRSEDCPIGLLKLLARKASGGGASRSYTQRGILMHSSLVVSPQGLPLGLAAVKFWTRKKFKGTNALKRSVNPTRIPIDQKESVKWLENIRLSTDLLKRPEDCVHIGDRESDIYELFCLGQELNTKFLLRTCVDRLAETGETTIAKVMKKAPLRGSHSLEVTDKKGRTQKAVLEVKYEQVSIRPPVAKQKDYPDLSLTVIHATEKTKRRGIERIQWKLITNLPVHTMAEAVEKLRWYAMRWKIETFHKIVKSGCRAEESKLRTTERLTKLISVFCIISWRVFWMSMSQRIDPNADPAVAITEEEKTILDELFPDKGRGKPALKDYLTKIARLGGYLARKNDPPPGNLVMWRGLLRLHDIQRGFRLGKSDVGN